MKRALLCGLCLSLAASAQGNAPLDDIRVEEHLHQQLPLQLQWTDSTGEPIKLAEAFADHKPVVLALVYYQCPMLCSQVLSALARGLRGTGLELGKDYRVITASIDPADRPDVAAEKKRGYLQALGVATDSSDWRFVTTTDEANIHTLADAVGFKYVYDAQIKQFAHAAVIFVATPDGKLSRYIYGIDFSPRDLRLALVEAAAGRVGTTFDRILLTCYQYDPATRKYGWVVKGILQTGGMIVFVLLAGMLTFFWRREFKRGTVA